MKWETIKDAQDFSKDAQNFFKMLKTFLRRSGLF
jgi:hypothetical protein